MSSTVPVPPLDETPECPACKGGRLVVWCIRYDFAHDRLQGTKGALEGYAAAAALVGVCVGDRELNLAPCGFSVPMTGVRSAEEDYRD